jgi:hypothetical protein
MIIGQGSSNEPNPAPTWEEIERHLVGSAELADLIGRLRDEGSGPSGTLPSILDVLGQHLGDVLGHGLAAAPSDVLDTLLRHPLLLRDLQGLIFAAGGDYWTKQIDQAAAQLPPEFQAIVDRTRKGFENRSDGR